MFIQTNRFLLLKAINEKIKQLDFQECKVRVLNVDSQASFGNILISVIGEISNKSEPSRKFVQTFVLAEQPNGYYVLNDIFRYLVEEEEELMNEQAAPASGEEQAAEAPAQPATEAAPAAAVSQVNNDVSADKVDEKLEQAEANGEVAQTAEPVPQVNGTGEEAQVAEPKAVEPKVEKPLTPEPTPASPAQKPAAAPEKETASPSKAVPKTWANIASKVGAAAPVVPAIPVAPPKPAAAASSSQPAAPPAVPAAAPATAPAAAPARESTPSQPTSNDSVGWQTAGQDPKKTQTREDQNVLAYIKNVNDKVDANLLRQTLSRFGKLKYFDVSRPKVWNFRIPPGQLNCDANMDLELRLC